MFQDRNDIIMQVKMELCWETASIHWSIGNITAYNSHTDVYYGYLCIHYKTQDTLE